MTRRSDALVGQGLGFNRVSNAPMVNLIGSGQSGMVTDLSSYISNAAYVKRNINCIVLQAPRGFNFLPNPEQWHGAFKALMETGSKTIDGLRSTITVQHIENPFGAAGEVQEDPSKVMRERSVPVHTFHERYGKPVNRFFDGWIRYLIADPETNVPAVRTLRNDIPDLLPDFNSASILYYEPDPLHKTVVEAWLITNMQPKTAGEVTGNRDIPSPGQGIDYSIEFTGIQQVGAGVIQFAQRMLDQVSLTNVNPNRRQAWLQEIAAEVKRGPAGYNELIQQAARQSL